MKFCRLATFSVFHLASVVVAFVPQKTQSYHQCHHQYRKPATGTTRLHAAKVDAGGDGGEASRTANVSSSSAAGAVRNQADMTLLVATDAEAAASSASSSVGAAFGGFLDSSSGAGGGLPLLAGVVTPLAALLVGRQTLAGRRAMQMEANQKQLQLVKARNDLANAETAASVRVQYYIQSVR
jgi:hypothetical protein